MSRATPDWPMQSVLLKRIPWSELMRFGAMGLASTGIYLAFMIPLRWALGEPLWLVSGIAYLLSMAINYLLQRTVTFRSQRRHQEAVTRFIVVQLIALGLNSCLLELLVKRMHHPFWLGQTVAVFVTAVFSYGAQKAWVFMKWGSASTSNSR